MEKRWWKESVVYQIYPRSFCDSNGDGIGDLNGITSKLDYLKELGVDVIWLSPVYKSPNDDNGYDISDYQDIMDEFGTMEDFDRMLATAHEKGIKIMMDLVVNHTSDEHKWFIESRKSTDNPYRDYYIWRPAKEDGSLPNNWGSCFSGPAWEYDKTTDMYFLHLFSKKQPDLNWDNPVVRQEVFDMMNWWLEKGVDGFRMDVISLISKEQPELPDKEPGINGYATFNVSANGPHVHEYLQEMRQKALNNADTITVGECSGVTLEEAKKYARSDEKELNMVFQFEHMDVDSDEKAGKWTTRKMDLRDLKKILTRWQKGLQDIAWNSLYWENHDQPRSVSRFGNDSDEYREISAKMLATCIHMMQGTPYVYQGEELGMTNCPFNTLENFRDLESINAFHELTEQGKMTEEEMMAAIGYKGRDNARTPMQWDDSANAGFSDASATPWIMVNPNYTKINAKDQISREDSVFKYYQKLIKLRHESDLIVYGTYDLILDDDKDIYAYIRTLGDEKLIVYCNFSENTREVELPEEFTDGKILISNYNDAKVSEKITLRPYEAIVIQK
ncbi:alpha-glucosidase [Ruminococcus sp. AM22-13]|nr:alpha-glucosidase [Ruminococcus sp.]RHG56867.1 alpha-glucosidase [Ruminococcus sp. AM22-13]